MLWSIKIGLRNAGGTSCPLRGCQWHLSLANELLTPTQTGNSPGRGRRKKNRAGAASGNPEPKSCSSPRAALPSGLLQMRELEHSPFSRGSSAVLSNTDLALRRSFCFSGGKGSGFPLLRTVHAGSAPSLEEFFFKSPVFWQQFFSHIHENNRKLLHVDC